MLKLVGGPKGLFLYQAIGIVGHDLHFTTYFHTLELTGLDQSTGDLLEFLQLDVIARSIFHHIAVGIQHIVKTIGNIFPFLANTAPRIKSACPPMPL